jgi:Ser/Thr protein kinase RdoA (MazF antagonist)
VPVRLHRWVQGTRPSVTDVDLDLAAWSGRTLATLHGLRLQPLDASLFPVPSTGSVAAWPDLLVEAWSAGAPWASLLAATADAVDRAGNLLVSPVGRATVLSHGDFALKNLLVTATGPVLCDWDVAMPRVAAWDLADVAVSVAGWRSREHARTVRSAYAAAGGSIAASKPEDLGPTLMVRLDYVSLLIHRALGLRAVTAEDQAAAHAQLPALLRELPHQVSVAESLATWLG